MLNNKSVLIVEDEPAIALCLSVAIQASGGKFAGVAAAVDDAIDKARTLDIDLAILDFNLADGTTTGVAKILTSRRIPFIFYTACGSAKQLEREWPGVTVLSKPAGAKAVIESLANAA